MKIRKILSVPRSFVLNIKWFGWYGVKIPILISNNTKVGTVKKESLRIINPKTLGIQIGFGGTEGVIENKYSFFKVTGIITFNGKTIISAGSSIRVDSGELVIGNNFFCNKNCFISCSKKVIIGKNVLLGWNVNVRDNDGHTIYNDGYKNIQEKDVIIKDNVWLASYVDILKGSIVSEGSVVGYRSCMSNRCFDEKNVLILGNPAKVVKKNISWRK